MADYKNKFRERLEVAQKQGAKSIDVFFDQSRNVQERLAAIKNFGTFNEHEHVQNALGILSDNNQNEDIRTAALEGLINEVGNNEKLMDEVISILKGESAPVKLRRAALSVLQANSFTSDVFSSKRPAYLDALRTVIDDDDKLLKQAAMEYLAMSNDSYLQARLIEGLNDPKKKITRPEVAIQLLSYDLHADHFPILRKLVENPPNSRTKKEALRNLAADPASKDLLLQTLQNKAEDPEIRHVSAVALESLSPGEVQSHAKKIILDDNENEELKAAMLNTLTFSADTGVLNDPDFENKLDSTHPQISSPNLKKMYSKFKSVVKQSKTIK